MVLGSHKTAATIDQNDTLQKEKGQARSDAELSADSIIASAKQLAQETVTRAEAEAEQIKEEAAKEKQRAISEVRGHIETIMSAAKAEAERVVADARRKAEEEANDIVARARREAEAITRELAEGTKRESGAVVDAASRPTGTQESGDAKPHRQRKPQDASGEGTKPTESHAPGERHDHGLTRPYGTQSTAAPPDESVLYYGEVELRISVPPDGAAVRELEDRLQTVAYLGVGRPQLSETGSVSLVVNARAPTPILRIVKKLAIVKDAVPAGKDIELVLHSSHKGQDTPKPE